MKHSPKFNKLMQEKKMKGHTLSGAEKKAREETLGSLSDHMNDLESDKVKGLKKVTVASNSPKGLKKGVDMLKEGMEGEGPLSKIMSADDEMMEAGDELAQSDALDTEESPEAELAEHEGEEEGMEEKDAKIAELEAKIAKLKEKLDKLA